MTSTRGWSSPAPVARSGSVTAWTSRHIPTTTRPAPSAPARKPRRANGRNCRVIALTIPSHGSGRSTVAVSCRRTWATPSASSRSPMNTRPSQRLTPMPGWSQRRSEPRVALTGRPSSALELAMEHVHVVVALLPEAPCQLLSDHDRAVETAGAADPDREPALAVGLHRRDREVEELVDELEEPASARLAQDVVADLRRQPRLLAQCRHVVRVLE